MKYLSTLFFLLNVCVTGVGQHPMPLQGVKGIWDENQELESRIFEWKAQWIWMKDSVESDVMLARRSFQLSEESEKVELRITATSQYQLFINGEYVCRGPARSAPHHQSFDLLEITNLLQKGKNTLAVRVHYQKGKYSYHHNGRAGLLAELDISSKGREYSVITDAGWKVTSDPSWSNEAAKINRFQLVVNDKVDLRKRIKGWKEQGFDDSNWTNATVLMRNVGWPSPQKNAQAQALTPPWTSLILRDVPYLRETEERALKLIEAVPMEVNPVPLSGQINAPIVRALPDYQKGSGPLVIPASDTAENYLLLFDFGRVLNGMPQLDIEGASGTSVDILSAPFMVNNQFTHKVVDSDFMDRILLSGERDRWEATYFKPTRYLGIVIRSGKEPVKLYAAGIRHITYPFEQKGHIHSTDAFWVEQYMQAAAKTIQVCTTDGYTDNYRERRQYAQTGYYAALGNYWTFGDHALQRRYLVQVAQEQEANGIMPAYAPMAKDDYMIILDSNCLWIRSLRNYFLYSGETKTIRELLPAARKLMGLLHSYTNALGFINNPPYPYWLDHALNDRRGANFNLNAHYLGALEDFAQVLDWLGEAESDVFQARADLLRQSLGTHLWDPERQLFADAWIDGELSNQFSEHANGMALAMNVANQEQADLVAKELLADDEHNYIKRASGITMVTPAMSYFLHKGLCSYGYTDESFQLLRDRFDRMLAPNTNGTLWEEWWLDGTGRSGKLQGGRTRSDAQTESAFPPALFAEYLLGINPSKPGMKEVEISRPQSAIQQIEAIIPSPKGDLHVKWNFDQNTGGELELEVPGDMQVKLDIASFNLAPNQSIVVDGKELKLRKQDKPFIILSGGSHQVSF